MSKLRHDSRAMAIRDYLVTEGTAPIHRLTDEESREQLRQYIDAYIARLCRTQEQYYELPLCPQCSKRVWQPDHGRPRIYCSKKCRQAAYRDRRGTSVPDQQVNLAGSNGPVTK
jgi:hypothetical protein